MGWVWFSQIMERFSFSLPRLTSVVVITACEREVGNGMFKSYTALVKCVILIIKTMSPKTIVNNVLNM